MLRITAGVIGAVLIAVFAYTAYLAAGPEQPVTPTNGVTAGGAADSPEGDSTDYQALVERTQMQRWRGEYSDIESSDGNLVTGTSGSTTDFEALKDLRGAELVDAWLADREDQSGLLRDRGFVEGTSSLQGPVVNVFEQPQGRTWRAVRNNQIIYGGGLYIFAISAALAIFLAIRGRVKVQEGWSGQSVLRFNLLERANHWVTAISFLVMALTGLVILYGAGLVRPWLGAGAFSVLAEWSAWSHLALVVPFMLGLIVMAVLWTWQNLPRPLDWHWLKRGGGFLSDKGDNPPADRFNAGQKVIFWSVMIGGLLLFVSGLTMMFPFLWAGYTAMEVAHVVHAVTGLLMIGVIIGHIYIGTVGMQGAFDAIWSGRVDRNWAEEHHSLWYRRLSGIHRRRS